MSWPKFKLGSSRIQDFDKFLGPNISGPLTITIKLNIIRKVLHLRQNITLQDFRILY